MMLGEDFEKRIIGAFGNAGEKWLKDLPRLIKQSEIRFELQVGDAFELSYNYVAKAIHKRTNDYVVLKLSAPTDEFQHEMRAIKAFAGKGAVKLLDKDEELNAMVLSFVDSKRKASLTSAEPASAVMNLLPRVISDLDGIPTVEGLFNAFSRHRERFGGPGVIDKKLFEAAEKLVTQLLSTTGEQMLLHGDLHGGNILHDGESWIAIDPKGVVGEQAFEPAQFFLNVPIEELEKEAEVRGWLQFFEEHNDLDQRRVAAWAFCKSILSIVWFLEDNDTSWSEGMKYSKALYYYVEK